MRLPDPAKILATPSFLKLDIMCRGLRLAEGVKAPEPRRTRAGLGSGLELVLPQGFRLNAPVVEPFARKSPYVLRVGPAGHEIFSELAPGAPGVPVSVVPVPAFYERLTSSGKPMGRIGVLQGTVLSVYVGQVCGYWASKQERQCRFCATGLNVGASEDEEKTDDEIVELAMAARRECGVTFIHLNMGYGERREAARLEPLIVSLRAKTGLLIGVQIPPQAEVSAYDRLIRLGVDHVSFCVELGNPEHFARVCPGKAETVGHESYFEAIEYCARRFRRGAVSGEIIAGIEPVADTLAVIERITDAGAFPTVCVFRPLVGTAMQGDAPPPFEEMYPVLRHLYNRLVARRIPVGVAPNISVSIIITPAEARAFAEPETFSLQWGAYHAALLGQRALGRLYYWARGRT
jgi:hypothetical protein